MEYLKKILQHRWPQYKILVQTIPDIVYEVDIAGRFTFVSEGIRRLGYTPEDLVGKHFQKLIHPDDLERVSRRHVLPKYKGKITGDAASPKLFDERRTGNRMTENLELKLVLKTAKDALLRYCYVELHSSGKWSKDIKNENKRFLGSVGIIRDVTSRRQTEKELEDAKKELETEAWGLKKTNEGVRLLYRELAQKSAQLEKVNQLKSQFVANVSHEFKNPLALVKEALSLVVDGVTGQISPQQKEVLERGRNIVNRLDRLVMDLLDLAQIEAGKVKMGRDEVNIILLVEDILKDYQTEISRKRIDLRKDIDKEVGSLWADKDKLTQVVINLLSNAIKYTPEEGSITIRILRDTRNIRFEISDTGPGIHKEHFEKIFDKFERIASEKSTGTGLGLSISKDIIELHKGRLWVESEVGKGSKFIFVLPRDLRR